MLQICLSNSVAQSAAAFRQIHAHLCPGVQNRTGSMRHGSTEIEFVSSLRTWPSVEPTTVTLLVGQIRTDCRADGQCTRRHRSRVAAHAAVSHEIKPYGSRDPANTAVRNRRRSMAALGGQRFSTFRCTRQGKWLLVSGFIRRRSSIIFRPATRHSVLQHAHRCDA